MGLYRNTNTNQALRDIRGMVAAIPENRSMRSLREAKAEGENLRTMAGLKQAELALPAQKLESQTAQDTLDRHNTPFHISQAIGGNVGEGGVLAKDGYAEASTPAKTALWAQDQKEIEGVGKVPPAFQQLVDNVGRFQGYKLDKDGYFVDKNGQRVPNRLAGPILKEARRIRMLNTDPIKARDMKVAKLTDALEKGNLKPEEAEKVKAMLERIGGVDEIALRESYLSELNRQAAEDEQFGRDSKLMGPMIKEQVDAIARLRGAAAEASKRQFEMDKIAEQNRGKVAAAVAKNVDKLDPVKKIQLTQIYKNIGELNSQLATGTKNVDGEEVPLGPEDTARILAQIGGLTGQAQAIQGKEAPPEKKEPKPKPVTPLGKDLDRMLKESGIENKAPEVEEQAPEPQEEPKEEYSKVWRDKDGVLWGKKGGQTQRIQEPPAKIYNGTRDNPEYAEHLLFLKKYGLNGK